MGAWIPPGKGAILGGHLPAHCNVWCREFVVLALQKRTSRSSCRLGLRLRCVHVVGESLDQRRGNLGGRVGSCPPSYNIGWVASVFCPPKKFSNIYPVDWKVQRQCRWHCWGELQRLLPNTNVLVAVSKGMWAVKFCTNKILQFLTGGASWRRLTCIMAVKRWLLLLLISSRPNKQTKQYWPV